MTDTVTPIIADTDAAWVKADFLAKDCRIFATRSNLGSAKVENEGYGNKTYAKEAKNTGCPRYAEFVIHGINEKRKCGRKATP